MFDGERTRASLPADLDEERAAMLVLLKRASKGWAKLARRTVELKSAVAAAREAGFLEETLFDENGGWDEDVARAKSALAAWAEQGIVTLTVLDVAFPQQLLDLKQLPPILFMRGHLLPSDAAGVAIIGSRRASQAALATAERFGSALARAGVTVISGLAAGVDAAAHRGALAAGGRTVGVIGTGINRSYPPENLQLQAQIAAEHCVISQFWPDAAPSKASFPMRNEVMSGLASGTLVIQADERSGARLQARLAVAQGRRLYFHSAMRTEQWALKYAADGHATFLAEPDELMAT